jgi:glycosyltransferase involved in cell wall biosynthesis
VKGIHLFVPMLHRHDAVGEHTRSLRDLLVASGVPSRIYTEIPDPATIHETRPYREYEDDAERGDILVYQFATRSLMADWLTARDEPLVINYHSITPPRYFEPWNNGIARLQVGAQHELALMAPRAALGVAVSEFDAEELRQAGCARTTVIPVANVAVPPVEPDPVMLDRLRHQSRSGGARWLSVGRLVPNKSHQHTIASLFVARASADPAATLTIVGSPSETSYAAALRRFAGSLGLADAVEFVSGLRDAELAAFYCAADVLVMLSEHEGFGVPLVEAMAHGLPIVAYDAGAVREVLDGAGVLLDHKGPRQVARAVADLTSNPAERERLVDAGHRRVAGMELNEAGKLLVEAVQSVVGPRGIVG